MWLKPSLRLRKDGNVYKLEQGKQLKGMIENKGGIKISQPSEGVKP